jgi:hypothetical protein
MSTIHCLTGRHDFDQIWDRPQNDRDTSQSELPEKRGTSCPNHPKNRGIYGALRPGHELWRAKSPLAMCPGTFRGTSALYPELMQGK